MCFRDASKIKLTLNYKVVSFTWKIRKKIIIIICDILCTIVVGKERRADDQMLFQTATHDFIFVASWISETLETKEKDLKIRTIFMCMMVT